MRFKDKELPVTRITNNFYKPIIFIVSIGKIFNNYFTSLMAADSIQPSVPSVN